ncbi:hypothetical protein BDD12DRAFT_983821 [Trichophaea hybrida]|nr:hypothetical protein BDD12DRAFT_983821 [Trichophaea hybrida]
MPSSSPQQTPGSLGNARIKLQDKTFVPLLDNFHVTWLEREKERWVENGRLTRTQKNLLPCDLGFANKIKCFGKIKEGKREIHDVYILPNIPNRQRIPSLVVQNGTVLDEKEMLRDMRTWMKKGKGSVRKVILMIWKMLPPDILGARIEVYDYNAETREGKLTQEWVYVPESNEAAGNSLKLKKSDLFGGISSLPLTEEDGEELLEFCMDSLCEDSVEAIRTSGLQIPDDDSVDLFKSSRQGGGTKINCGNINDAYNTKIDNSQHIHNHHHFPESLTDFLTVLFNKTRKVAPFFDINQLGELAKRFYTNSGPALTDLSLDKRDTTNLSTVALYDVMILCDDSGSMNHRNRYKLLAETVHRITPVATKLNEAGISLRFINYSRDGKFNDLSKPKEIERKLKMVAPGGTTKIGTMLRSKIIEPILEKAKAGTLDAPVLVVIITDGEPSREPLDSLKNAILHCKNSLAQIEDSKGHVYGHSAVVFQISYVGDDAVAEKFVRDLANDPQVGGMIHCNLEKLDVQLGVAGNAARNRSLLKLLTAAIEKS